MDSLKLIILILILGGFSKVHAQHVFPKTYTPTTAHQFPVWDGTQFKLKELVGFTVTGTQVSYTNADGTANNEGILGVGAGSGTSSVLLSNTTGATGVTINATSPLTITESPNSNGGSITLGVNIVDGSVSNEGALSLTGNMSVSGVALNSNTSGSSIIKIIGRGGINTNRNLDTLFLTNNIGISVVTNHSALTVNNSTLTTVNGTLVESEEEANNDFTIYLHYTTGATSQGLQFRIVSSGAGTGTYWYDYNFPTTGGRQSGAIYNANTTVVIPSSESGTNIGIIRGISRSTSLSGIFQLDLQVSAEDGSSTISVLTTGVTQR